MILALYGAGAMGRELKLIADTQKTYEKIVFIDDIKTGSIMNCPIYSFKDFTNTFSKDEIRFVTALGEPRFRKESYEKMKQAGYIGGILAHPTAYISEDAEIGEDVALCYGAFVGSLVKIGNNFHASIKCTIGHDVVIGDHVRIGSGAFIGGHTLIKDGAFIGSGSMLKDRISFGKNSVASLGSAIFNDVPDNATVVGNPGRIVDENRQDLLYNPNTSVINSEDDNEKTIAEKYWDVFSNIFAGIDFNPASFKFHDSGWDSITHMRLITSIEESFNISLKGREIFKVNSYRAGFDMVKKKLEEKEQ